MKKFGFWGSSGITLFASSLYKYPGEARLAETGQSPSTANENPDLETTASLDHVDALRVQAGGVDVVHHLPRDA
jgi:hypothetical protein